VHESWDHISALMRVGRRRARTASRRARAHIRALTSRRSARSRPIEAQVSSGREQRHGAVKLCLLVSPRAASMCSARKPRTQRVEIRSGPHPAARCPRA